MRDREEGVGGGGREGRERERERDRQREREREQAQNLHMRTFRHHQASLYTFSSIFVFKPFLVVSVASS